MDEQDFKIKAALQEKIELPSKYTDMIQNTLRSRKIYSIKETLYRIFVTILATILGMSGVCFASVKIYNEYIKKQEEIASRGLFDDGSGITTYETDLIQNDMIWDDDTGFSYKIISDFEDYKKYKKRIAILPDMTEDDIDNYFLVIITWQYKRMHHLRDLEVYDVTSDETTTYITYKQKENPNYDTENNIMYAVISKEKLRDNIKLQVDYRKISIPGFVDIEKLDSEYSLEDAVNDGCFVLYNNVLKSKNPKVIDDFIEKTENGENATIRVYREENFDIRKGIFICDVEYKDGIYYVTMKETIDQETRYIHCSYEKIVKHSSGFGISYAWVKEKEDVDDKYYSAVPFLIFKED